MLTFTLANLRLLLQTIVSDEIIPLCCLTGKEAIISKHLTLSDRAIIEKYLAQDYSFAFIAHRLHRSATTISREVKSKRCFINGERYTRNDCINYPKCLHRNLCDTETMYTCFSRCKLCTEYDCHSICKDYVSSHCILLDKAPYVCINCPEEKTCNKIHAYYSAQRANAEYNRQLRDCRKGIRTAPDRLIELNELISPLIRKGQSINHIFASHADEIGLSERTIYNYIDSKAFDIDNLDLPKKVRYRQRRPQKILTKLEYQCRKGRCIDDFKSFIEQNPNVPIVEMDTVRGARHSGQVLLTMIFRENNFMLIFLLPDGTHKSVLAVFDRLTLLLGIECFRKLFPVILTDNGVEFKGAHNLEYTDNGVRRTRIFYCDPQASWQKPHVEKNHALIRRILPKGTSFADLTEPQVHLLTCHINSVARELFDNFSPFDLMKNENQKKLLDTLALSPVPPDEVCLKPALLKRIK